MSPEAKARISASMRGRRLTAEHRAHIGAANRGRTRDEATRARITESRRAWSGDDRVCDECGTLFTPTAAHQSFCTAACRKKNSAHRVQAQKFDALRESQGGRCAICHRPSGDLRADTSGGCCRGLLCVSCCTGVGAFAFDPALLRAAAEYLAVGGADINTEAA
jgi:hypothetical protein